MSLSDPWTIAFTQVAFISSLPTLILLLFPNSISSNTSPSRSILLKSAKAISAGGLIGDVFLHSLPETMSFPGAGLAVIAGFIVFMSLNLIAGGGPSDSHSHPVDEVVDAVDSMIDSSVRDVVKMDVELVPLSEVEEGEREGKHVILDEESDDVLFTVLGSKGGWVR